MTSVAMVVGMIPMASGLGEGGDQTSPLARAVIGGLLASTFAALVFLPLVFAWFKKQLRLNRFHSTLKMRKASILSRRSINQNKTPTCNRQKL
jgi:hypothetical protein